MTCIGDELVVITQHVTYSFAEGVIEIQPKDGALYRNVPAHGHNT